MNISAAIICGGMSRRFGSDKTLAVFRNKPLISWAADGIKFSEDRLVVAKEPSKYHFLTGVRFVGDIYDEQCPLAGILTAFHYAVNDLVFVIPADMPLFPFNRVSDMAKSMRGADVVMPLIAGKHYPCAAVYHRRVRPQMEQKFHAGEFKLMNILKDLEVLELDEKFFGNNDGFLNINRQEDMNSI